MKYITSLFAMVVCGLAYAQDQAVEPAAPVAPVPSVVSEPPVVEEKGFSISLDSSVNFFDFDDGMITQIDTEVMFDVAEKLKLGFALPIFNQSDVRVGSTGLADLDVFTVFNLIDGKCDYLANDHVWLDFTGGVKVPLDGKYSSGNEVFHLGTEIGGEWGPVSLSYGFSYDFVDEYTFSAALGGFIYSDIFQSTATIGYKATDELNVYFAATQYQWDGNDLLMIGPGFNYQLNDSMTLGAELSIPTTDTTEYSDLNICMSAGIGFKF